MAVGVLDPAELTAACTACHNEQRGIRPEAPEKTRLLLGLLVQASEQLALVEELIALREGEAGAARAKELLEQAYQELRRTHEAWHTFQLRGIEGRLMRVFRFAERALEHLEGDSGGEG
jgi:hypothetical protein